METVAAVNGRHFSLSRDGENCMSLPLDQGGRYRITVPDAEIALEVVTTLEKTTGVGVLPADGGLLGSMTVAENWALAVGYAPQSRDGLRTDWEQELQLAMQLCGLTQERMHSIPSDRPTRLNPSERWMVGLIRNILCPPELLVLDRVFTGLSRQQTQEILAVEAVYHDFHPFRPCLFVEIDSHALPEIPDCHCFADLKVHACPY
jgi:ABC-type branched-subunit amino acid transport system ATPase component